MKQSVLVQKSVQRARWVVPDVPLDDVERVARAYDLPEIIARMLCARGIAFSDIPAFIAPSLKNNFPDPFSLAGMGDMASDLAGAIEKKEKIAIFGDFDVDGATSSAILYRFLKHCGVDAPIYIPGRMSEGYGPNIAALKSLRDKGAEILLILDCGTTAFDVIEAGSNMGLKIIILDHHEAEEKLPHAWHVINPKRRDDNSGLDMLAACGVTFMACVAVNNLLRERGFYTKNSIIEPDLRKYMDILALGTVCDMVPLIGCNRLFVRFGFSLPYEKLNAGIRALMDVAAIKPPLTTYHAGYVLGPRINAGSRVHQADLGARLLCSDDKQEARDIAWVLDDCNKLRREIQAEMEREAVAIVEQNNLQELPLILVAKEGWHPGLSGLVAGNLKEKYKRPACVVAYAKGLGGKIEGRGSGRSVAGVHIANAFIDARNAGLLEKGGGHAMAGGFTVLPDKLDELYEFLNNHVKRQMESGAVNVETSIDGTLSVGGITVELISLLQKYIAPFGQEFPEPVFALTNVKISKADIVGASHIRLFICDEIGGKTIKAMAFRAVGTDLGEMLLSRQSSCLNLAGTLKINEWQGRSSAEMHIIDAALAGTEYEKAMPA